MHLHISFLLQSLSFFGCENTKNCIQYTLYMYINIYQTQIYLSCLLIHEIAKLVLVCFDFFFFFCVCWFDINIGCWYCCCCFCYENKIVQLAKWVICQSVCCMNAVSEKRDNTAPSHCVHGNTWRINRKEICK